MMLFFVLFLSFLQLCLAQCNCPSEMACIQNRFCIDKWEAMLQDRNPYQVVTSAAPAISAPNVVPQGYISGTLAEQSCQLVGKRLCSEDEWENACKGPGKRRTYPYGTSEINGYCNVGKSHPVIRLFGSGASFNDRELNDPRLNQLDNGLARTGANPRCVTVESGVFDMHGNLHEWTSNPGGVFRGGFYVDGYRNGHGCNYRTRRHNRAHRDYSTGFRCCANAQGNGRVQPAPRQQLGPPLANAPPAGNPSCSGECLDTRTNSCGVAFLVGACPGLPNEVRCCTQPVSGQQPPNNNNPPPNNNSPPVSSHGTCTGVSGQCLDIRTQSCGVSFLIGACPGLPNEIRCCTQPSQVTPQQPAPGNKEAVVPPSQQQPPAQQQPPPAQQQPPAQQSNRPYVGSSCINGASGTCQDVSLTQPQCSVTQLIGKCRGDQFVRCCPTGSVVTPVNSGGQQQQQPPPPQQQQPPVVEPPANNNPPPAQSGSFLTPTAARGQINGPCEALGNPGKCLDENTCVNNGFQAYSNSRLGGNSACRDLPTQVRCCSTPQPVQTGSGSCEGLTWPIADGSNRGGARGAGLSFGGPRCPRSYSSRQRCHVGVDLLTLNNSPRTIKAVSAGEVVANTNFIGPRCRALFVYHDSGPLAGKTIVYGEIEIASGLRIGSRVTAGQTLGVAGRATPSYCTGSNTMLHFELYEGRRTSNSGWTAPGGNCNNCRVGGGSGTGQPNGVLDPTPLLRCLAGTSRDVPAAAFLTDAEGGDDIFEPIDETDPGLSTGAIAGIVISCLIVCCAIVGFVVFFLTRSSRSDENGSISVANGAFGLDGTDMHTARYEDDQQQAYVGQQTYVGDTFSTEPELSRDNIQQQQYVSKYECALCDGRSFPTAADLAHHTAKRH